MGEKEFRQDRELELLNKSSWELKDKPISYNISDVYMDPFSGYPRSITLKALIESYNDSNFEKAEKIIWKDNSKYINVVILPKWSMNSMDASKGDVYFTQEPCAYVDMYNSFDHIDEKKYIYKGKIRKGFKGKVFIIKEKGKTFYKVQDITSGKRYKFWPEDLEEIDSEYITDWGNAESEWKEV
jgi:hypothetical protein